MLELHIWLPGNNDFPVGWDSWQLSACLLQPPVLGKKLHPHRKKSHNSICACSKSGDLIALLVLPDDCCMTTPFEVPALHLEWRIFRQGVPAMCNTACKLLIRVLSKNSFRLLKCNNMYRQWQMKRRTKWKVQLAFYHYGTEVKKKPNLTRSQERPYLVSHTQSLWLGQKMRIIFTI